MSIAELLAQYGEKYWQALLTTWRLTFLSFAIALVVGTAITILRVSPIKPLQLFADFYVQLLRNIPGAVMLIILVYAFPYLKLTWPYFTCVLITTSLIPSAFCSEYLMAGMNTIPPGQIEAARSLGMTFLQVIKNVVLPQSLRSVILQMTNLLVATMLTTALASQVPLQPTDLTGIVSYINTRNVGGVSAFLISAVLYCATAVAIGQFGNWLDKKVRILR
jgi:glutamate transport system permease protein